jgi:hypothetical protein
VKGLRVAAFVSPHGFGHAARASAVLLQALGRGVSGVDIFTTAPRWFFEESLGDRFRYHEEVVDVGFRQRSALRVDLRATVAALEGFLPFDESRIERLAACVRAVGAHVVLCDISPLGVAVAEAAGLPSVLVENFSWGWLYAAYVDREPRLGAFGDVLDGWSRQAGVHVQARPFCAEAPGAEGVDPIGRPPRSDRETIRARLGLPPDRRLVVVTMGGFEEDLSFLPRLADVAGVHFLVTGAARTRVADNLHLFDNATPLYMPDVLRAADGVVAKLGYGMVAEVWREGPPFAHVTRPDFPEMPPLERYAARHTSGFLLTDEEFTSGAWIERIPELLALPRMPHEGGGASRVAEILLEQAGFSASARP